MGRHQTAPVCTRIVGVQPCFSVVVCTKVKCDPPTGAVGAFATSCAHNLSFLHYIGHPLHWLYQWNAAIGITNGDGDSPSSKFINLAGCQDPILHCIALHCIAFNQNICCCSKLSDALLLHFHKIVTQLWFSPSDCKNTESNTFTGNTGNTGWTRSIFLIHTPSFKTFTYKKRSSSKAKAEPRFLATEMHLHD